MTMRMILLSAAVVTVANLSAMGRVVKKGGEYNNGHMKCRQHETTGAECILPLPNGGWIKLPGDQTALFALLEKQFAKQQRKLNRSK